MITDLLSNINFSCNIELKRLFNKAFVDVMLEEGAAEDENIFTIVSGTNAPGNPICSVTFPIISDINSRKPDARKIPTAAINPINVGISRTTVQNPRFAP